MITVMKRQGFCKTGVPLKIRGGEFTMVDADMFDFLDQFSWFALKSSTKRYICTRRVVNRQVYTIRLHRLITYCPDNMEVHHVDGDTFHNCLHNLLTMERLDHARLSGRLIFRDR